MGRVGFRGGGTVLCCGYGSVGGGGVASMVIVLIYVAFETHIYIYLFM